MSRSFVTHYAVINVQAGIPGSGKSKKIREFCKANPDKRVIIISDSHNLLEEHKKYLPEARHLKGMTKICPLRDRNETIKKFIEAGIPVRLICNFCQKVKYLSPKKCVYKAQFVDMPNHVLMTTTHLFTKYPKVVNPEFVFADDISLKKQELPSRQRVEQWLKLLIKRKILGPQVDYDYLLRFPKEHIEEIERGLKNEIVEPSVMRDRTLLTQLFMIEPKIILDLAKLTKIHGKDVRLAIPCLFPLFELAVGAKVTLVGACPNLDFLYGIAKRFFKETKKTISFEKLPPLTLDVPKQSRVLKVGYGWLPKASLGDSRVRERINNEIENIILGQPKPRHFLKVGIVSHKEYVFDFIPDNVKEVKTAHYDHLVGLNELEDVDLLFVIGTYNINLEELPLEFELFFARPPHSTKHKEPIDKRYGFQYLDKELENFRIMRGPFQMYQGGHRGRLSLKPTHVYIFGVVPYWLKKEFQVTKLEFEFGAHGEVLDTRERPELESFMFQQIGKDGITKDELVQRILEHKEFSLGHKPNIYKKINNILEDHPYWEVIKLRIGLVGRPKEKIHWKRRDLA